MKSAIKVFIVFVSMFFVMSSVLTCAEATGDNSSCPVVDFSGDTTPPSIILDSENHENNFFARVNVTDDTLIKEVVMNVFSGSECTGEGTNYTMDKEYSGPKYRYLYDTEPGDEICVNIYAEDFGNNVGVLELGNFTINSMNLACSAEMPSVLEYNLSPNSTCYYNTSGPVNISILHESGNAYAVEAKLFNPNKSNPRYTEVVHLSQVTTDYFQVDYVPKHKGVFEVYLYSDSGCGHIRETYIGDLTVNLDECTIDDDCDDSNPCTSDVCNSYGCTNFAYPDGEREGCNGSTGCNGLICECVSGTCGCCETSYCSNDDCCNPNTHTCEECDLNQNSCENGNYLWVSGSTEGNNASCCGDDGSGDLFYNTTHLCQAGALFTDSDLLEGFCTYQSNTWFTGDLTGSNSPCCGDDGGDDDFYNSSLACIDASTTSEHDDLQGFCEAGGYDWFTGDLGGSNSPCCGDDGVSDDFYNSSLACSDGSSTTDKDALQGFCEANEYDWFTGELTGNNEPCCGDDTIEDGFGNTTNCCRGGEFENDECTFSSAGCIINHVDANDDSLIDASDSCGYSACSGNYLIDSDVDNEWDGYCYEGSYSNTCSEARYTELGSLPYFNKTFTATIWGNLTTFAGELISGKEVSITIDGTTYSNTTDEYGGYSIIIENWKVICGDTESLTLSFEYNNQVYNTTGLTTHMS